MISTKTAKSKQTGTSNCATTPKRRGAARKKAGAANLEKRSTRRKTAEPARPPRRDSKRQLCLNLLCRAEGASIEDLQQVTGWQTHTVRGFLSGQRSANSDWSWCRTNPTTSRVAIASSKRPRKPCRAKAQPRCLRSR
jgi:hypothetical protein